MRAACWRRRRASSSIDIPPYDYPESRARHGAASDAGSTRRDFDIKAPAGANEVRARVIGVIENQAPTKALEADLPVEDGLVAMDRSNDVCQIAVVERHKGTGKVVNALRLGLRLHAGLRDGLAPSRMTATT